MGSSQLLSVHRRGTKRCHAMRKCKGYAVYGFDQRGHGKSQGQRGYVERFSHSVSDLKTFSDIIHSKHRDAKIFIVGHSVGGTIANAYMVKVCL